ncbi:MAG TPA: hypothetical protein VLL28_06715 [Hyphomicrobiaceae bacterium]|nr:hypothetical protein [Hyphomicrobiaceae bacterium]
MIAVLAILLCIGVRIAPHRLCLIRPARLFSLLLALGAAYVALLIEGPIP